ncbi:YtxH domain-containing protein [Heyndrickxia acidicola]|uniref:YtxH domain-containing protein n=1 Tax=Heyndrickxia acidicola TaxID=209389 RepID=A0ABU6MRQ4_9BACI|nr:YtxH domain-containing protein [Heyndrickxia acidicola]MED1205892.1 YtxH domain-containing protein [Heyndrickxia acidicola]
MVEQRMRQQSSNSKLLKGIMIGGAVGALIAMLDSSTRNKMKETAMDIKDSSMDMISHVKDNPGEVKEQMMQRFKTAAATLKDAMNDLQHLYENVNEGIFGKVNDVKDISKDALSSVKYMTEDLKEIGSKFAEAGSELMDSAMADSENSLLKESNKNASLESHEGSGHSLHNPPDTLK